MSRAGDMTSPHRTAGPPRDDRRVPRSGRRGPALPAGRTGPAWGGGGQLMGSTTFEVLPTPRVVGALPMALQICTVTVPPDRLPPVPELVSS